MLDPDDAKLIQFVRSEQKKVKELVRTFCYLFEAEPVTSSATDIPVRQNWIATPVAPE